MSKDIRNKMRFFWTLSTMGLALLGFTMVAFGETPTEIGSTTKEVLATIIAGGGVLALLGNVAWSFFSRKSHDKLKESVSELEKLLEIRKLKSEEQDVRIGELQAKLTLESRTKGDIIAGLTDTNISVTRENMQMRAILKALRLEGKWTGDEDDVWKGYLTHQK